MSETIYTFKNKGENDFLPFNPELEGFRLVKQLNCCLHFHKDNYELRIKTASGIMSVREIGKSRLLTNGPVLAKNQEDFKNKLSSWL